MDLNRGFAGSNFGGYLLVGKAGNNQWQHFSLTRCKPFKALPQGGSNFRLALASGPVALQRYVNCIQQILIADWLGSGTRQLPLSLPGPHWNVAIPDNKDDRNGNLGLGQFALEIEPANSWQSDIEDQATRHIRSFALQKLLRRAESSTCKPTERIRLLSELRTDASSSTTNTMDWGSVMRYCPG
jgi:hypothetical protein